jgi:serine phosphatase RsbU (regulator of sigma subunit)
MARTGRRPPHVPRPSRPTRAREFFETYTRDLRGEDLRRLFTLETPEAYRFFARGVDEGELARLPWHVRMAARVRTLFMAFALRLSPPRRAIYGIALVFALFGLLQLFHGIRIVEFRPIPFGPPLSLPALAFDDGALWLGSAFILMNLLLLLELADRLTLKHDLEIAREIQLSMLPRDMVTGGGLEAYGFTRPANTVGGDFYDVVQTRDGRVLFALGDVAGKGSPAALLMALVLAILRTLVDEGLEPADLAARLNAQVSRNAPGTRFVTMFIGLFDPSTGALTYVNAGQTPPLLRRVQGPVERLTAGGMALGMFELATFEPGLTSLAQGDVLVLYSDGVTEAENTRGEPFDEAGVTGVLRAEWWNDAAAIGRRIVAAVEAHAVETRLADDVTVLTVRRPIPVPVTAPVQ